MKNTVQPFYTICLLFSLLIIGCNSAENISTPRIVDVVTNGKDTAIRINQIAAVNVQVSGLMNISQSVSQLGAEVMPSISKISLYRYPDSSMAIDLNCAVLINSNRIQGSIQLDSVFIRTGIIHISRDSVVLGGNISSNDTLASKLAFTVKQKSFSTTIDSSTVFTGASRQSTKETFTLYNLDIIRTIDSNGISEDTIRIPFNPFASPYDTIIRRDSVKIIVRFTTNTAKYSNVRVNINPITKGQNILAPSLFLTTDRPKKSIKAKMIFDTSADLKEYFNTFNGENVRIELNLDIPIP